MLHVDSHRIDPAYRAALAQTGLTRVDDVLARTEGRICAWSRTTDTLHVPGQGGMPGFFVKRYLYPNWKNRLRGMFRGTFFGRHRGRAEYDLLSQMRVLGLPSVRPVAYGARRVGHFLTACYLITEEVPEASNLTVFARRATNGPHGLTFAERRAFVRELARQVAEVHAAEFAHGQLFWRNILVRTGPAGDAEFFLLDPRPGKAGRRIRRKPRWWLHELAHLAVSAGAFTTRTERLRFLVEYLTLRQTSGDLRELAERIERQSQRWARHEQRRIRMSDRFESWRRALAAEKADEVESSVAVRA